MVVHVATCSLYQVYLHANRMKSNARRISPSSALDCQKWSVFSFLICCEDQKCELFSVGWLLECVHFQFYHYFCPFYPSHIPDEHNNLAATLLIIFGSFLNRVIRIILYFRYIHAFMVCDHYSECLNKFKLYFKKLY